MGFSTEHRELDQASALRDAIERTGYYPEVVSHALFGALGKETVEAFYVHHEPTFERDEVKRHLTVLALTPTRLIFGHTDEFPGDELLPEPYTSSTTEAISIASVRSVVVTRMVTNATSGRTLAAEAVLAISWGAVGRIDLEPAGCSDPACEADHGYTGLMSGDDFSLRVSAAAEGADAVHGLLNFADALSAHTSGS